MARKQKTKEKPTSPEVRKLLPEFRNRFGQVLDTYKRLTLSDVARALREAEKLVRDNVATCDLSGIDPKALPGILQNHAGAVAAHRLAMEFDANPLAFLPEYRTAMRWFEQARNGAFAAKPEPEEPEDRERPAVFGKTRPRPWIEEE